MVGLNSGAIIWAQRLRAYPWGASMRASSPTGHWNDSRIRKQAEVRRGESGCESGFLRAIVVLEPVGHVPQKLIPTTPHTPSIGIIPKSLESIDTIGRCLPRQRLTLMRASWNHNRNQRRIIRIGVNDQHDSNPLTPGRMTLPWNPLRQSERHSAGRINVRGI